VGVSGLTIVISTNAVQAAPAGLAGVFSGAALAKATAGTGTIGILKLMATTKLKAGVIGTVLAASAVSSLIIEQQSLARIRRSDQAYHRETSRLAQEKAENERLSNLAGLAAMPPANTRKQLQELRSEVAALRQKTNGVAKLQTDVNRLQQSLNQARSGSESIAVQPTVQSEGTTARIRYSMQLAMAAMEYASHHHDEFPTNLLQASKYFPAQLTNPPDLNLNQFEIVYTGSRDALGKYAHLGQLILIRQKDPWRNSDGKWVKAYSFCDGSGRLISVANGDFDSWERAHTVPSEP
jgi:hypothetical protein